MWLWRRNLLSSRVIEKWGNDRGLFETGYEFYDWHWANVWEFAKSFNLHGEHKQEVLDAF